MTLKITNHHYTVIVTAMGARIAQDPDMIDRYRNGDFPRADRTKDVAKRFRWDLFHMSINSKWVCDNLYPYLNDDHIDSALRQICKSVILKG